MAEPRFLVVRLGSLGDIVHTFPAVAGLRGEFSNSEIVWLTSPRWKMLVESSSLASQVWTVETRDFSSLRESIGRIRKENFSASIDYQGLWKSAALPFLGGVKKRIGFSSESVREFGVPILYTDRVRAASAHVADQNEELSVRAGAKTPVADFSLRIPEFGEDALHTYLRENSLDRYVVLSPGGGWRSKCWPAERFGALCRKIRDSLQLRCVVNYGPGEEHLAESVRAASGDAVPLLYNGELGPLMALLRNAVCIVGGDTGPLHLGVALGARVVAIFGPTDPARNGPYHGNAIVLRDEHAATSYKRQDEPDSSLLAIRVDDVFDAVQKMAGVAA
jgi:lipopolysaccharide heptosyltransferase I